MTRRDVFLIVTGLVGLTANALAILGAFSGRGPLAGWRPDPGLLIALSFVAMAYVLAVWSALAWRWAQSRAERSDPSSLRTAVFLLNALASLPSLAAWIYLLVPSLFGAETAPTDRWLLALALAWVATPFAALGLTWMAEILGPLLEEG